ncbi:cbb3-type cytochrome oxidase assembly protein CcoS [Photobacterium damselae]|uniref:cbb3-type cytochrome oxidase assembly protein CcoS n=1 Tax=Photobacterium damselae TaxID=38293 RepID=UPI003B675846
MASLYILIPIAIIFVIIAVAIFLWAVKSDQYDDLERQGSNILFEEDDETTSNNKKARHRDNKNKDC